MGSNPERLSVTETTSRLERSDQQAAGARKDHTIIRIANGACCNIETGEEILESGHQGGMGGLAALR
jgi:hypothetical protein